MAAGKDIPGTEAWRGSEDEVRAAVEAVAVPDAELSARLLYRRSRDLMRRLGVHSPAELHGILRQVFWNAEGGVRFGDHLSVGFGEFDRRRQVRAYVACHPGEPRGVLAKGYEREYGFSAGVAAIWIDLFAEPGDVTVSEWLRGGGGAGANEAAEEESGDRGDDAVALTRATADAVDAGAEVDACGRGEGHEAPDPTAFLARELCCSICDAELVRRRFAFEFGDGADFDRALSGAGYYEEHGLLFRCGPTPNELFSRLILDHPSFTRGDAGFEDAVWKHPTFRYVLGKTLENHSVLLYDDGSYLAFTRLHDVLGVRMADIESYATTVSAEVSELEPFTVASLHEAGTCRHALDTLEMPDAFYEGLLDASGLFRSCVMAGTRVFCLGGEGRMSAGALLDWLVARNEGVERDDLPRLLRRELGVSCSPQLLTTTVRNSGVYYDDVGDAYYSSIEAWKKEARNELA